MVLVMASTTPLQLRIILGSTRAGRAIDGITPWLLDRATKHAAFHPEILDLRDFPMPMFGEGEWPTPAVTEWNAATRTADAFIIVTPEYNHSVPGVLKNAIDATHGGFRNKVAGFVGYSAGPIAGARAVEHLAHMAIEAEMVPLRNTVLLGSVSRAIVDGEPTNPMSDFALQVMLDDIAWWAAPLRAARQAGELPPGMARRQTAAA